MPASEPIRNTHMPTCGTDASRRVCGLPACAPLSAPPKARSSPIPPPSPAAHTARVYLSPRPVCPFRPRRAPSACPRGSRADPSEVIWHNRLKFVNRVRVLHAFHSARNGSLHCTAPVRWIHIKPHCCSWKGPPVRLPNGKLRRSRPGDGRVHTDGHPWPLYYGFANTSTCRGHEPVDLMRKYKWRASYGMDIDPAQNSLHEKA
jgi:hypothetical protein